jgi:hypothetical protein
MGRRAQDTFCVMVCLQHLLDVSYNLKLSIEALGIRGKFAKRSY